MSYLEFERGLENGFPQKNPVKIRTEIEIAGQPQEQYLCCHPHLVIVSISHSLSQPQAELLTFGQGVLLPKVDRHL